MKSIEEVTDYLESLGFELSTKDYPMNNFENLKMKLYKLFGLRIGNFLNKIFPVVMKCGKHKFIPMWFTLRGDSAPLDILQRSDNGNIILLLRPKILNFQLLNNSYYRKMDYIESDLCYLMVIYPFATDGYYKPQSVELHMKDSIDDNIQKIESILINTLLKEIIRNRRLNIILNE